MCGSKTEGMWVEDKLCFIGVFRIEWIENLPVLLSARKAMPTIFTTVFSHTNLCRLWILEPKLSPIAILTCWSDSFTARFGNSFGDFGEFYLIELPNCFGDSFSLRFLQRKTFNHWERNLSGNVQIYHGFKCAETFASILQQQQNLDLYRIIHPLHIYKFKWPLFLKLSKGKYRVVLTI